MLVKNIMLTITILGISSVSNAQNLTALDENNGFQNYKFGMKMSQFQNCDFRTVEDGGAERCTVRRVHYIGDIETRYINLYFVDSKLSKIEIDLETKYNRQLLNAVQSAFGPPEKKPDDYYYSVNRTEYWRADKITLIYRYRFHDLSSTLRLTYLLKNYLDLQNEYRSKKYTPYDF
jgi:hypothetical protein